MPPASAPSVAPPSIADGLVGQAKRDYEAGRSLFDRGDYTGARSKLQAAYDASHDPRLLWDAAACEAGLRHYARAIALVHRYLESGSPLISPEAAHNATLFLGAAEPLTARLDVESSQPGALVFVDGEPLGALPLDPAARIDTGTRRISVKKSGFEEYIETRTVAVPSEVRVRAVLRAIVHQGLVIVRAGGDDAVMVDGVAVGSGTWESMLPSGRHSIVVTQRGVSAPWPAAPGSPPVESQIVVVDNQTRVLDLTAVDVSSGASSRAAVPTVVRVPTWVWIAGGTALAAGLVAAAIVLLEGADSSGGPMMGSVGFVRLPLQ